MQTAVFDSQIYQIFNPFAFKCVRTSTNACNVEFDHHLFFFGEFDVLTFTESHFEKPLIASFTEPTRKPPKAALKATW